MSVSFELAAEKRSDIGKGASRRLRREQDKIPAIIYGAGKDAEPVSLTHNSVIKALENEAVYSHILKLKVDGKPQNVVLKSIHRHPSKPQILHIDFLRVSAKEKITMQAPVHLLGADVAPGVKQGGVVSQAMTVIEISCLPNDLPEFIEVDVSQLELDQILHLGDVAVPKGVEFVALSHEGGNELPVVAIHTPKAATESTEEAAEGEAPAEGGEAATKAE
jgi:large subunit ribosomal protein L25